MINQSYDQLLKPWHAVTPEIEMESAVETVLLEDVECEAEEAEVLRAHDRANQQLSQILLGHILAQSPDFFEHLIIDLMLAMNYGHRRRDLARKIGRRGDCGVDGVIEQDVLGLDQIYIQAKRFKPSSPVPISDVRDFAGSLEAHRATKGVFVATSYFTKAARKFINRISRQVILIDGTKLTDLMIRYNIGVSIQKSIQFKRLDADYFSPAAFHARLEGFNAFEPPHSNVYFTGHSESCPGKASPHKISGKAQQSV